MTLYLVTGNASKLAETRAILGDVKSVVLDLPELQGDSQTIVKEKATMACKLTGKTVFVEDVSLCFDALGGFPGPYIKWFLKANSHTQIANMLTTLGNTRATAVCTIGLCEPGKEPKLFSGSIEGTIVTPRGPSAFGWDPIFQPKGSDLTFAQMGDEKHKISHRRKALEALGQYCQDHFFNRGRMP